MFDQEFWNQVEKEIEAGYIKVQKHPTENLWIYNYTQSAMIDAHWTEATMTCRGLIVDENKNIIARPIKKFMTLEQCESFGMKVPLNESFEVYDKLDGSMGILFIYFNNSIPYISTRGSFTSDQAIEATKIFKEKYSNVILDPNFTYLFEIIYPENRIVVDYGKKRDLILLAIVETATGEEVPISIGQQMGLNVVTRYHGISDFNKVLDTFKQFKGTEFEGLVIRFESGFRVKVKTEDYKRLHKIISGINEKRIHEVLSSGQGLQEILDVVDDSFADWVKQVEHDLMISYNATEAVAKLMYRDAINWADKETFGSEEFINFGIEGDKLHRKNFAQFVMKCPNEVYRKVCFLMYGNQDYKNIIWKSLEPKGDQRFKLVEGE